MSYQYDKYLNDHKANVAKAFYWIRYNLPELLIGDYDYEHQICYEHDYSKNDQDEYDAYDRYFYGGNRSYEVVYNFNLAWLKHIHKNPHHWQYWILTHDDPIADTLIDIPHNYIIEMICDWWSFSWKTENLEEIFSWYDKHEKYMRLSDKTRKTVEDILNKIKEKLVT